MRNRFPIYGRGKEFPRVRTEFGITEKSKTGINPPSFTVTRKTLPDGTRVKLTTIGQMASKTNLGSVGTPMQPSLRKANITKSVEGGRTYKCSFLSGAFDLRNWKFITDDKYLEQVSFKGSGSWVNSPLMWKSFGASEYSPALCAQIPVARYKPSSIATKVSSAFTGTMRKVVQILAGMNAPIPYDYCCSRTDGIYVAADGSHWVVRVDSVKGIFTQKIQSCETLTPERKAELGLDFDYIPSPTIGPWKKIADASVLSEYAGALPLYPECGWAFSYNGHEAQNMAWTWPDAYKRIKRFKLTITAGATGGPASASVSTEVDTYLWLPLDGGVKFPYFIPASLGGGQTLLTFDSRPDPIYLPAPAGVETRIPVYVYYIEGNDTDPVIIYSDSTGKPADEAVSNTPSAPFCPGSSVWRRETSPGSHSGTYGNFTKVFSSTQKYTFDGPISEPEDLGPQYNADGVFNILWSKHVTGLIAAKEWVSSTRYVYSEGWESWHTIAGGSADYFNNQALLIPFYDREQAFIYYKERTIVSMASTNSRRTGMGYGEKTLVTQVATSDTYSPCLAAGESYYYKLKTCESPNPTPQGMSSYDRIKSSEFVDEPFYCLPNECEGSGVAYRWYKRLGAGGPVGTCNTIEIGGATEISNDGRQALWAFNSKTKEMEKVKEWDEYEPLDTYTTPLYSIAAGVEVLTSYPDAFTGNAFLSGKMNGNQGDEYYYFGSADNYYPLQELTSGLDRGWFGVPF